MGAELAQGTTVAGKYVLVSSLASGGMGSVWVAHHLQLDSDVAIKFMDPELARSPELRARFEREARAAAKLKSQYVVRILDHGVDGDRPFIVMERLVGEDLRQRLRQRGRLGALETQRWLAHVGKGLSAAHAAGIIHRDLKPANIFITSMDGEEIAKLVDFGVAKLTHGTGDEESTRTGLVVGSPSFMSPEQARATRQVDARSDLWSLGVILFRALTGKLPFEGASTADLIVKICAEPIPRATVVAPDLPKAVDAFFERALARDPEARFQSIDELVQAFARLTGERTSAVDLPSRAEPGETSSPSWGQRPVIAPALGVFPASASEAAPEGTITRATTAMHPTGGPTPRRWVGPLAAALVAGMGAAVLLLTLRGESPPTARSAAVQPSAKAPLPTATEQPPADTPPSVVPEVTASSSTPSASAAATLPETQPGTHATSPRPRPLPGRPAPSATGRKWGF